MDIIRAKHRNFEIVEILSNDTFKCIYRNKIYLIKKYDLSNSESSEELSMAEKLSHSNVRIPRIKYIDKKQGYVVKEFVEGSLLSDYILEHDFDENIYKQVFRNSFMARVVGLNLDYSLAKWMLVGEELYYIGDYCEKYNPNYDFTKGPIRMWFLSKELANFYEKLGILFDKNRIKDEKTVNKEMVLMTCKYYQ